MLYYLEKEFEVLGLQIVDTVDKNTPVYSFTQIEEFIKKEGIIIGAVNRYARIAEFFGYIYLNPNLIEALKWFVAQEQRFGLTIMTKDSSGQLVKVENHEAETGIYLIREKSHIRLAHLTKQNLMRTYNNLDDLHGVHPFYLHDNIFISPKNLIIESINQFTDDEDIVKAISSNFNLIADEIDTNKPTEMFTSRHNIELSSGIVANIVGVYEVGICAENHTQVLYLRNLDVTVSKNKPVVKSTTKKSKK